MLTVFEKYLAQSSNFNVDRSIFESSYIPERLPHRDREIDTLARIYYTSLKGQVPKNVLMFGKTGTGKTAVAKYIVRELKRAEPVYGTKKIEYLYINCEMSSNAYSILQTIGNAARQSKEIPFTGWPLDKLYEVVKENLENWGGTMILILDEIDRLVANAGDDVIYQLLYLSSELNHSGMSIMGISNELKFTEYLDARVKSRLSEEKIIFAPYNALQIEDILRDRIDTANLLQYIENSAIKLAASIAAQEHGDARRAINLLSSSIEIAGQRSATMITENDVMLAKSKIETDAVFETVKTLPPQSKLLLLSVILNDEAGKAQISTGELFESYKLLSKRLGFSTLTIRRVTDITAELDMLGLINAKVKSFGRYGRTKIIELSVPGTEIKNLIMKDEYFSQLGNFSFSRQTLLV